MYESTMREKAVDLYVTEFQSLRDEIFARFESQRQAFNYLIALLGAIAGLFATLKPDAVLFAKYLLILPLIAAPLGFIFFDNEIIIWSITKYIHCKLRPRLFHLIGEEHLFQLEGRGSIYLLGSADVLHSLLSIGRWLLFLLPLIFPIGYALWTRALWDQNELLVLFRVLIVMDSILTVIMIWAIRVAVMMRRRSSHCSFGSKRDWRH